MPIRVTHLTGRLEGLTVVIDGNSALFGRDPSRASVTFDLIEDRVVSGVHARVDVRDARLYATDCRSLNGTFVAGERIRATVAVEDGCVLELGKGGPTVRVEYVPAAEATPPEPPPPAPVAPSLLLKRLDGAHAGQLHQLRGARHSIGRDPSCDLTFDYQTDIQVSRRHAAVLLDTTSGARLVDTESQNGTLLNGSSVKEAELSLGDIIELGPGGPKLQIVALEGVFPEARAEARLRLEPEASTVELAGSARSPLSNSEFLEDGADLVPIGSELIVGRDPSCGLPLQIPTVSAIHSVLRREGIEFSIRDYGSTNGTYVNGRPIGRARQVLFNQDLISIGGQFLLFSNGALQKLRLAPAVQAFGLSRLVPGTPASSEAELRLLIDNVTLEIAPGQFVGIVGPTGCGKTSLLQALSGLYPAQWGQVYLCGINLYDDYDSLRGRLGCVPQRDLLHEELTVRQSLHYAALLRLPTDTGSRERAARISDILSRLRLSGTEETRVGRLSGGERKRLSAALELLAEPDILFLDEPTAGLDPRTEQEVVDCLGDLALQGKTVVIVTHMLGSIERLDRVVVLVKGGRLAYAGKPSEVLAHFSAASWRDLYCRLDEEGDHWAERFSASTTGRLSFHAPGPGLRLQANVRPETSSVERAHSHTQRRSRPRGIAVAIRQTTALSGRFLKILLADTTNLAILLLGPFVLAGLIAVTAGERQNVLAMLVFSALFFGCFCSSKEVVRERDIFLRERLFSLGLTPYLLSKVLVLGGFVLIQALTMVLVTCSCVPSLGNFGHLWLAVAATGLVGLAEGLLLSVLSKTADVTSSALALLVIFQMLFAGVFMRPPMEPLEKLIESRSAGKAAEKIFSFSNPAFWSFEAMKRAGFSTSELVKVPSRDRNGQPQTLSDSIKELDKVLVLASEVATARPAGAPGENRQPSPGESPGKILAESVEALRTSTRPAVLSFASYELDVSLLAVFFGSLLALALHVLWLQERWRRLA